MGGTDEHSHIGVVRVLDLACKKNTMPLFMNRVNPVSAASVSSNANM